LQEAKESWRPKQCLPPPLPGGRPIRSIGAREHPAELSKFKGLQNAGKRWKTRAKEGVEKEKEKGKLAASASPRARPAGAPLSERRFLDPRCARLVSLNSLSGRDRLPAVDPPIPGTPIPRTIRWEECRERDVVAATLGRAHMV